ncbi:MAG: glycosyltransferase family 9 protein [bacterium]
MSAPRFLAIRFGALGDLVLATCVIDALAKAHPGCAIDFVTKQEFAPILEHDPRIARVIAFDGSLFHLLREVRRERYEVVLDLHDTPRSRVVAWAARGGQKRRFDKRSRERRALIARPAQVPPRLAGGVVGWYGEMFGAGALAPRLIVDAHLPAARALIARAGVPAGFLAVAPCAGRRTKEWPVERTRSLLDALHTRGSAAGSLPVALIGSAADVARLEGIARDTGTPIITPALAILPAVLSLASILVTPDSAPLHVAEAVGTPVVALFGPTVRAFGFAPRDPRSIVIEESLACRPCTLHGGDVCPLAHHRCLSDIDAARVVDAIAIVRAATHFSRKSSPNASA